MKRALLLTLIASSLTACSDPIQNELDCGDGDPLTFRDQTYCVFEQSIIETGFECPPQNPHRFDIDGGAVCAQTPEVPDLEQIAERVRDGWEITEPEDPARCDDATMITCDQTRDETTCPAGQISAAIDGCYQCVDANTCMPPVAPVTNGAQLQLLHHMPGPTTATVDVYLNGILTFDDLSYREASAFVDIPDGNFNIEIRDATGTQVLGGGTLADIGDVEDGRYIALMSGTSDPVTNLMAQAPRVEEIGRIDPLPPSTDYFATFLVSASLNTTPIDVRSDNEAWSLLLDNVTVNSNSGLLILDALTDDLGGTDTITKAFALTNNMSVDANLDPDKPRYTSAFLDVTDRGGQFGVIVLSTNQDPDTGLSLPDFVLHTRSGGPGEVLPQGL